MEDAAKLNSLKNVVVAGYVLQALGFLVGLTWIAALILGYVKRPEAAGTWLESHLTWQIRTFWWGLLWGAIGTVLAFVLIGIPILIADGIWVIYRIVKGWLNLYEAKPVP